MSKILIVDDNEMNLIVLKEMIKAVYPQLQIDDFIDPQQVD